MPAPAQTITFVTSDLRWLNEAKLAVPIQGRGLLMLPPGAQAPVPAVVLLHSSQGQGAADWAAARRLLEGGYAVFAVDSFGPRGLKRIKDDQTAVSEAAILADAFAALDALSKDPRIDSNRIALMGFSKGAIAAFYAAFQGVAAQFAPEGRRFAAHVAFHPWCGFEPRALSLTGAPIIVHSGGADTVTPAALCADVAAKTDHREGELQLHVYPGARHAFEHPLLARIPVLGVGYEVPKHCRIVERPDGTFEETHTGRAVTGETYGPVIRACSVNGGSVGGDREAGALAWQRTLSFLGEALAPVVSIGAPAARPPQAGRAPIQSPAFSSSASSSGTASNRSATRP